MTHIVHLSDPHFGAEAPRLVAPLLAAVLPYLREHREDTSHWAQIDPVAVFWITLANYGLLRHVLQVARFDVQRPIGPEAEFVEALRGRTDALRKGARTNHSDRAVDGLLHQVERVMDQFSTELGSKTSLGVGSDDYIRNMRDSPIVGRPRLPVVSL